MKDLKIYLYAVVAFMVLLAIGFIGYEYSINKNSEEGNSEITTNLKVTLGDEEIRETIVMKDNGTVVDQYKSAVLEFNDDAGYVTKIAGKSAEGMCGFVFEVNDEEIMKAASDVKLKDGDTVHWFYVCFE